MKENFQNFSLRFYNGIPFKWSLIKELRLRDNICFFFLTCFAFHSANRILREFLFSVSFHLEIQLLFASSSIFKTRKMAESLVCSSRFLFQLLLIIFWQLSLWQIKEGRISISEFFDICTDCVQTSVKCLNIERTVLLARHAGLLI